MQGINARIARKIVAEHTEWFPDFNKLTDLVQRWSEGVEELPVYDRARMSDSEVTAFIKSSKYTSRSSALRGLRDSGRACEQARFARIYQQMMANDSPRPEVSAQ